MKTPFATFSLAMLVAACSHGPPPNALPAPRLAGRVTAGPPLPMWRVRLAIWDWLEKAFPCGAVDPPDLHVVPRPNAPGLYDFEAEYLDHVPAQAAPLHHHLEGWVDMATNRGHVVLTRIVPVGPGTPPAPCLVDAPRRIRSSNLVISVLR